MSQTETGMKPDIGSLCHELSTEEKNPYADMTYHCTKTPAVCKSCGSRKAVRHYEKWSDGGGVYCDVCCPECGWTEVY